jgi:hypothetical protein
LLKVVPPLIEYSSGAAPFATIVILPSLELQVVSFTGVAEVITGSGFTVIVYVLGVPVHPFSVGVTVIVAETGEAVLLTAVKLGTLLLPAAASPIDVFEFVQVYVAPAGRLLKLDDETVAPEHILKLDGTVAEGSGLTEIIYEDEGPTHPFNTGVTVMVELIVVVPGFEATKVGISPLPLAGSPMAVLEFVQV